MKKTNKSYLIYWFFSLANFVVVGILVDAYIISPTAIEAVLIFSNLWAAILNIWTAVVEYKEREK